MKMAEKRNPALVELILVILFFALASMIELSRESRAQTLGLIAAEDLLEQWKELPTQPEQLFSSENGWEEEAAGGNVRTFRSGCNEEMQPVPLEQAVYELRAELDGGEGSRSAFAYPGTGDRT